MPTAALINSFERTRGQWEVAVEALVPLIERIAIETVADVLPGATALEVHGEINEDWLRVLRITCVRSASDEVLFDVVDGRDDPRVQAVIDDVNVEYLDLLMELTGDAYHGDHTLQLDGS